MIVAIDFGITNTDVALFNKSQYKFFSIPSKNANESFIDEIISLVDTVSYTHLTLPTKRIV